MNSKVNRINELKEHFARGFLSKDQFENERRKIENEVDWSTTINKKYIIRGIGVLAIGGLGWVGATNIDQLPAFDNPNTKPKLEAQIQEMCECYDKITTKPSIEVQCAQMKKTLEIRVARDSLEKPVYDSLVVLCPNYPDCDQLANDFNTAKNDSSRAEYTLRVAQTWQFLRTSSQRQRDIEDALKNLREIIKQKNNLERRVKLNCN